MATSTATPTPSAVVDEPALTGLWYVGIGAETRKAFKKAVTRSFLTGLQIIASMCGTAGKIFVRLSTLQEKKHPMLSKFLLPGSQAVLLL